MTITLPSLTSLLPLLSIGLLLLSVFGNLLCYLIIRRLRDMQLLHDRALHVMTERINFIDSLMKKSLEEAVKRGDLHFEEVENVPGMPGAARRRVPPKE